jgi:hypothetical protein
MWDSALMTLFINHPLYMGFFSYLPNMGENQRNGGDAFNPTHPNQPNQSAHFKTCLKTAMTRLKSVSNASKLVFGFQN